VWWGGGVCESELGIKVVEKEILEKTRRSDVKFSDLSSYALEFC